MLKDRIEEYYIGKDYNCAESMLHAINDEYSLGLRDEDFLLVGAFGGGCGCGMICGALAAAMSALGRMAITERAHATEGFKELCADYVDAFRKRLSAVDCADIKPRYFEEDTRCLRTVLEACTAFEEYVKEKKLNPQH